MHDDDEPTKPTIEDIEPPPIVVAGTPPPIRVAEPRDLGGQRHDDERKRETQVLRNQYDAFVLQGQAAMSWTGVAAIGTIVALEAGAAIMHVGRHHFVKFDIASDLHARVPDLGSRVSIGRDGAMEPAERADERVAGRDGAQR